MSQTSQSPTNGTMFTGDQKIKLTQLINEGITVMREVKTLQDGLSETVKSVAEELNINANILKKAIRVAHKAEFHKTQQDQELLETILVAVGKTI